MKDVFYCFKCNKMVVSLYYHLKQDHNITIDEYLEWIYIRFDQQVKTYRKKKQ